MPIAAIGAGAGPRSPGWTTAYEQFLVPPFFQEWIRRMLDEAEHALSP